MEKLLLAAAVALTLSGTAQAGESRPYEADWRFVGEQHDISREGNDAKLFAASRFVDLSSVRKLSGPGHPVAVMTLDDRPTPAAAPWDPSVVIVATVGCQEKTFRAEMLISFSGQMASGQLKRRSVTDYLVPVEPGSVTEKTIKLVCAYAINGQPPPPPCRDQPHVRPPSCVAGTPSYNAALCASQAG